MFGNKLLSQTSVSLAVLALLSLQHAFATPAQSPVPKHILKRAGPKLYMALGDSYASGVAAGSYLGSEERYFGHIACSQATCQDVQNYQQFINDRKVDIVTLTVGGNDVEFGDIVDQCVYGFSKRVPYYIGCEGALNKTDRLIQEQLYGRLWDTIKSILYTSKASENPNLKLMVTNYPKPWNATTDQCDQTSWNIWKSTEDDGYRISRDLRSRMNALSDKMNGIIKSVVESWNKDERRVHYVDIDRYFEGHRFCENEYNEPWLHRNNEPNGRPNQWIYQLGTPLGNLSDGQLAAATGNGLLYAKRFQEGLIKGGQRQLKEEYRMLADMIKVDTDFGGTGGVPLMLSKIFHPTSNGQQGIANAIRDAIGEVIRHSPMPDDIFKGPDTSP